MALKIVKASEPITIKNLIVFVYGDPGIGKTSRAFSASRPILFDFDNGAHRAGQFRKDSVPVSDWLEVANLTADDLADYDTVIIDTAGRMLDCITSHLCKDAKNRRKDGALSLQGFGVMGNLFSTWLKTLRGFGKDIILLAHAAEDKKGENIIIRPDMVGKSKSEAYKVADLMSYMTTNENQSGNPIKVIDFRPSTAFLAKDSGALGCVECPDLRRSPTHMADVLKSAKDYINNMSAEQARAQSDLEEFRGRVLEAENAEHLNTLLSEISKEHPRALEMRRSVHTFAGQLDVVANSASGKYEDKPKEVA